MFLLLSLALSLAADDIPDPELRFSSSPVGLADPVTTIVEVGALTSTQEKERQFWLRRTVRTKHQTKILWTDTRRCPIAKQVIASSVEVPLPARWIDGVTPSPDEMEIMSDGVEYALEMDAYYETKSVGLGGRIRLSSNVGTPLANWVEKSLHKLEPCWSRERPTGPLRP